IRPQAAECLSRRRRDRTRRASNPCSAPARTQKTRPDLCPRLGGLFPARPSIAVGIGTKARRLRQASEAREPPCHCRPCASRADRLAAVLRFAAVGRRPRAERQALVPRLPATCKTPIETSGPEAPRPIARPPLPAVTQLDPTKHHRKNSAGVGSRT